MTTTTPSRPALIDETSLSAARRAFLRSSGLAAAGLAALGAAAGPAAAQAGGPSDAAILNFALNLEYLEAEFYLQAAFGRGLRNADITGTGQLGDVRGGRKAPLRGAVEAYAMEIADDEENHVQFLRAALGPAAVARPKIDFTGAFTAAARAAGVVGPNEVFNPFATQDGFLLGAFIFEDVGVTAYKGAARFIDNKDVLEAAAGILAVEAYHAGEIRTLLFGRGIEMPSVRMAANLISNARGILSGDPSTDQRINRDMSANIVPADENSLAFSRTTDQVLGIVYLGGDGAGGFFPNGLNGPIA